MPKSKKSRHPPRTVPYVKGFHRATAPQQLAAIGSDAPPEFLPGENHFRPIPKCESIDDWLAQYKEEGQTYDDFLRQTPWLSRRKVKYMQQCFFPDGEDLPAKYPDGAIYILPLGLCDSDGNNPDVEALVEYTQIFFGLPVKLLPSVKLESDKGRMYWVHETLDGQERRDQVKSRHHAGTGRYQLCVDEILLKLRGYMPDDGICMIALTMCDLYEAKPDLFVAGMAAGNHRVAIFSLYRYDPDLTFSQEFWYSVALKKKRHSAADHKRLVLMRSCRLLVHEISHLLGVGHCVYYECCMNGSGHLEEDFRQPMFLCPVDLRKLQKLCGFDVLERYARILGFYDKHKMTDEAKWYRERIEHLESLDGTLRKTSR